MFLTALPLIINLTQTIILTEIVLVLCTCYCVECTNNLVGRAITIRNILTTIKAV